MGEVGGAKRLAHFVKKQANQLVKCGLSEETAAKIVRLYGSNCKTILEEMPVYKQAAKTHNLPLEVIISIQYGIKHEMMVTPSDYFLRRVSTVLFDIHKMEKQKEQVIKYMKYMMNWDEGTTEQHREELNKNIRLARKGRG